MARLVIAGHLAFSYIQCYMDNFPSMIVVLTSYLRRSNQLSTSFQGMFPLKVMVIL